MLRSAAALMAMTLAGKLLGFAEKQTIAYYFGVGPEVDAYFVALSIPMALFLIVRELVEPAYLPLYVAHLDANRREAAGRLFFVVGVGILLLILPFAALAWYEADALSAWVAPGFSVSTQMLSAQLIRIMIGGGALLAISALTYITLNGHRRFALPAAGDLILKSGPIVCALLFASQLGVMSLAIGLLVGCTGRLLVHVLGLARERRWLSMPTRETRGDARTLSLLMAPLVLGVAFSQVSELADNFFASQVGSGAVAARTYARKIVELPIVLVPYALSVVVFPHLSSLASRADWETMYRFLGRTLHALVLIFAFLGVTTALLAEPIVTLLFERGAFGAVAREATVWPLRLYAAGLVAFATEAILVPFYFALRDTRTPILVGIGGVCINIALTAALIPSMGVGGVALALTVSKSVKVIVLILLLKRKRSSLAVGPAVAILGRVSLSTAAAALGIWSATTILDTPAPGASILSQLGNLGVVSAAGAIPFLFTSMATGSSERQLILDASHWLRDRATAVLRRS